MQSFVFPLPKNHHQQNHWHLLKCFSRTLWEYLFPYQWLVVVSPAFSCKISQVRTQRTWKPWWTDLLPPALQDCKGDLKITVHETSTDYFISTWAWVGKGWTCLEHVTCYMSTGRTCLCFIWVCVLGNECLPREWYWSYKQSKQGFGPLEIIIIKKILFWHTPVYIFFQPSEITSFLTLSVHFKRA